MAARGPTLSERIQQYRAEIKPGEEKSKSSATTTALAGRNFRRLKGFGQDQADQYAQSHLLHQAAKIDALFSQFQLYQDETPSFVFGAMPEDPKTDPAIEAIKTSLKVVGIGIEDHIEGAPEETRPTSEAFTVAKQDVLEDKTFTAISTTLATLERSGAGNAAKRALVQTQLINEIALTCAYVEEFFPHLESKKVYFDVVQVLEKVLNSMGLQLCEVELPAEKADRKVTSQDALTVVVDTTYKGSEAINIGDAQAFVAVQISAAEEIINTKDGKFDLTKLESDEETPKIVKTYLELAAKEKTTFEELQAQVKSDFEGMAGYSKRYQNPLLAIKTMIESLAAQVKYDDGSSTGKLTLNEEPVIEVEKSQVQTIVYQILLRDVSTILKKYTDNFIEFFKFEQFEKDYPQAQHAELHQLINALLQNQKLYGGENVEFLKDEAELILRKGELLAEALDAKPKTADLAERIRRLGETPKVEAVPQPSATGTLKKRAIQAGLLATGAMVAVYPYLPMLFGQGDEDRVEDGYNATMNGTMF